MTDRHPHFTMSDRVRAWVARRPGPERLPSATTGPPCVDCTGDGPPALVDTDTPSSATTADAAEDVQ